MIMLSFFSLCASAQLPPFPPPGGCTNCPTPPHDYDDPPPVYPTNAVFKWAVTPNGSSVINPAVGPDGTVYTVNYNDVWAIYPNGQSNRWEINIPGLYGQVGGIVLGADNVLYLRGVGVTNSDPTLQQPSVTAVSANTGEVLWYFTNTLGDGIFQTISMGPDGTLYCTAGDQLFALTNGPSGPAYKWHVTLTNSNDFTWPAVAADGTIYLNHSNAGKFAAFNPDGTVKWIREFADEGRTSIPAIGSDGTIYFGTYAAPSFYALNPDGTSKWTNTTTGLYFELGAEITQDGTILVEGFGTTTNALVAFSTNGTVKWSMQMDWPAFYDPRNILFKGSSCAVAADGEIYVADWHGMLYSLAPNGTTNWTYDTGKGGLMSPIIGPDGSLYISSTSEPALYCFAGPSPIACSPWPQYGKNARNTRSSVATTNVVVGNPIFTTNGFQFQMSGTSNMPVCICASRNLNTWTNIGRVVLSSGSTNFLDAATAPTSTNYTHRFYYASPE